MEEKSSLEVNMRRKSNVGRENWGELVLEGRKCCNVSERDTKNRARDKGRECRM